MGTITVKRVGEPDITMSSRYEVYHGKKLVDFIRSQPWQDITPEEEAARVLAKVVREWSCAKRFRRLLGQRVLLSFMGNGLFGCLNKDGLRLQVVVDPFGISVEFWPSVAQVKGTLQDGTPMIALETGWKPAQRISP